jgi:hypothetical protein
MRLNPPLPLIAATVLGFLALLGILWCLLALTTSFATAAPAESCVYKYDVQEFLSADPNIYMYDLARDGWKFRDHSVLNGVDVFIWSRGNCQ